jgi:error-prone DNA polymerase
MGFYRPAQIAIDARRHGAKVMPVDINHSHWDNTSEEKEGKYCALRLGFLQVKGLQKMIWKSWFLGGLCSIKM